MISCIQDVVHYYINKVIYIELDYNTADLELNQFQDTVFNAHRKGRNSFKGAKQHIFAQVPPSRLIQPVTDTHFTQDIKPESK